MAKHCKNLKCKEPHYMIGDYKYHYKAKSSDISKPKQKPIKPISDKLKERLKEYRRVRDAYMESHPFCEFKGCYRPSNDLHHKKSRKYHLCDTSIFMAVCRNHHDWIHTNHAEAEKMGYLLKSI